MLLPLARVLDLVPVNERIRRKNVSNCFRSGGKEAISTPIESSVADQMERLVPSHVGSRVFIKAESSTVFATEQAVALKFKLYDVR